MEKRIPSRGNCEYKGMTANTIVGSCKQFMVNGGGVGVGWQKCESVGSGRGEAAGDEAGKRLQWDPQGLFYSVLGS